jgi:hypothetical protein
MLYNIIIEEVGNVGPGSICGEASKKYSKYFQVLEFDTLSMHKVALMSKWFNILHDWLETHDVWFQVQRVSQIRTGSTTFHSV